jgi:DNA adenine methylase
MQCLCGCRREIEQREGKGRPGQYATAACRKRAERARSANIVTGDVTKMEGTLFLPFQRNLRSPLPWMGGKYHMAPFILSSFPATSAYDVYVEPFAGACHVLMQKPVAHHYEAVNDLNGDLVNFWMRMRECPDALLSQLQDLPYSRQLHYDYHRSLFDGSELDPLERAVRWFYVLQSSFSCHLKPTSTGWKNRPRDVGRGQPHAYHTALSLFDAVSERLKCVEIDNRDFEAVIKQHAGPRTLFYVDPPYLGVEDYYKRADGGFTMADHERLARVLASVPGYVALSSYEHPALEAWYPASKWRRLQWQTRKHSQRTKTTHDEVEEVLLLNYEATSQQLPLFELEA